MNYQCSNCEEIFSSAEAALVPEQMCSEFWGSVAWETRYYYACPSCGSDEIQEHIEDGEGDDE
jgi:predicted  nucleic acid-binding Zn-ribbon protein